MAFVPDNPARRVFDEEVNLKGQSLTEYSLVIGLVALASIAGVATLGGNISNQMTQSVSVAGGSDVQSVNMSAVNQNLNAPNLVSQATTGGPAGGGASQGPSGSTKIATERLCPAGLCANFPLVSKANELVDVSAGEGAEFIHQFANSFEEMALAIESQPNPDTQLAALIRGLAVNGHDLGDKQSAVLSVGAYATVGSDSSAKHLGYINSKKSFDQTWGHVQTYLNNHQDSVPPDLQNVLNRQQEQINLLYKGVQFEAHGKGGTWSIHKNNPTLIHQSANTICGQQDQTSCMRPIQNQETAGNHE
jgi:Flp pilus assembly pilin Flp